MSEPTMWYEVYYDEIKPFTVVRETDKCLFYLGRYSTEPIRRTKERNLFRSEQEARAYLIAKTEKDIAYTEERLTKLKALLARERASAENRS